METNRIDHAANAQKAAACACALLNGDSKSMRDLDLFGSDCDDAQRAIGYALVSVTERLADIATQLYDIEVAIGGCSR